MAVYVNPTEVPFDEYTVVDEGDEVSRGHEVALANAPSDMLATALSKEHIRGYIPDNHALKTPPHLVVPFTHTIELGYRGRDVIGAKRAIWKANGLHVPVKATPMFGVAAQQQLRKFQHAHDLTPDGVLGPATLKALAPYFDQLAFFDYEGYPPNSKIQDRIVAYCWWGYNNRGAIGYSQFRPMSYLWDPWHLPINEDCSTFTTKAYKEGGAKDPNGKAFNYNGYGNTGTQRNNGTRMRIEDCMPADLAHYSSPDHVCVVVRGGSNAAVIGLGSPIGPLFLPIDYRPLWAVMRYSMN
jgi:peptidoglycan hydrolase-like protein with peptidoglycan-binding domain